MNQLNTFLLEQKAASRRVLLIIDEAQTLSENTLEQVRLLSNLETSREKLIQILLLGQPELDRKLDERGLRQLRQRISVRWKLDPLDAHETRAYVRHRLSVAAGEPKDLFSEAALREIHRRTGGIPRLVNQLCDRSLLAGYAERAAEIGPRLVRAAAREIPDTQLPHDLAGLADRARARPLAWLERWRSPRARSEATPGSDPETNAAAADHVAHDATRDASSPAPHSTAHAIVHDDFARGDADPGKAAEPSRAREKLLRPATFIAGALAIVGIALFAGLQVGRDRLSQSMRASVGKPAETFARPGDAATPAVAANAATSATSASATVANGAAANAAVGASVAAAGDQPHVAGKGPPIAELIGFVPPEIRAGLRPTPSQLAVDELLRGAAADPAGASDRASLPSATAGGSAPGPIAAIAPRGSATDVLSDRTSSDMALTPGLLADFLTKREATRALAQSAQSLLDRFGRGAEGAAPAPTSPESLQSTFERRGLTATTFEGGSIDLLRRLDHPVTLPLASSPDAEPRWIAITGFAGDRARVAGLVPGRIVSVASDELESHWLETGIIVWERFESVPDLLAWGDEGGAVLWLQQALKELGTFEGEATSRFDDATFEAVSRFQRRSGLIADGVAGPLTQIALYAQLGRYPVPRLSQSTNRPRSLSAAARATPPTPAAHARSQPHPPTHSVDESGTAAHSLGTGERG